MKNFKEFIKEAENFLSSPEKFDSHKTDKDDELHHELNRHYTKIPEYETNDEGNIKTPGVLHEKTPHHDEDLHHLMNYTSGTTSQPLNSALWNKNLNNKTTYDENKIINEKTPHLDRIMNYHKTPKDLTLYSGSIHDPREKMNSEGIMHHPAYLSTSLDRRMARTFAQKHGHFKYDENGKKEEYHEHTLHIHVPKGSSGAYVAKASIFKEEKEFLLPSNTKLKYMHTDSKEIPNKIIYKVNKTISHSHHMQLLQEEK